jgi:hypothetical protein
VVRLAFALAEYNEKRLAQLRAKRVQRTGRVIASRTTTTALAFTLAIPSLRTFTAHAPPVIRRCLGCGGGLRRRTDSV